MNSSKLYVSEYLTTGQAATLCSVTSDAVLKWIKAGKLPASRTPGGHYRIHRHDIQSIIVPERNYPKQRMTDRPFQYCWEFNSISGEMNEKCKKCIVYRSRSRRCYEMSSISIDAGHGRLFCETSCENCDYFEIVRGQRSNVLVISDQMSIRETIESGAGEMNFNLEYTDCEYKCSMLVEKYRPDYAIIDCAIGSGRAQDFALNLYADPRIPYIRIIMVGDRIEFPTDCDREVFAYIERPVTAMILESLFDGLDGEIEQKVLKTI